MGFGIGPLAILGLRKPGLVTRTLMDVHQGIQFLKANPAALHQVDEGLYVFQVMAGENGLFGVKDAIKGGRATLKGFCATDAAAGAADDVADDTVSAWSRLKSGLGSSVDDFGDDIVLQTPYLNNAVGRNIIRVFKNAPLLGALVNGGIELYNKSGEISQAWKDKDFGQVVRLLGADIGGAALGGAAAGAAGAWAGAKAGALIGSAICPGVGTVAGIVIGAATGYVVNEVVGHYGKKALNGVCDIFGIGSPKEVIETAVNTARRIIPMAEVQAYLLQGGDPSALNVTG